MRYIRDHLAAKLFIANLLVIAVGVVILAVTIEIATPSSFNRHLGESSSPGAGTGPQAGEGGGQGQGYGKLLLADYRAAVSESLALAVSASVLAAVIASLLLSRRIIAPVQTLSEASQHVAAGNFDKRVVIEGSDEIAQLASNFNRMAAQLEEVEAMRRQLIGDVTHELRTPLTSIKGYMEGLVDGVLPPSAETFDQIHHEADRLSRLVDDLQELSRVESRAYSLRLQPVAVADLVRTTTKRLSPQASAKDIALLADLPASLPRVLADEDRLIQVLVNLVANAIQYTPEHGQVTIAAARHGELVHISVRDSGIGIPPEHLPHLFTRFYRVDKSRARVAGGGSGIGLTIARHLVESHGGEIWAESDGEGKGSTFTFSIRIAS